MAASAPALPPSLASDCVYVVSPSRWWPRLPSSLCAWTPTSSWSLLVWWLRVPFRLCSTWRLRAVRSPALRGRFLGLALRLSSSSVEIHVPGWRSLVLVPLRLVRFQFLSDLCHPPSGGVGPRLSRGSVLLLLRRIRCFSPLRRLLLKMQRFPFDLVSVSLLSLGPPRSCPNLLPLPCSWVPLCPRRGSLFLLPSPPLRQGLLPPGRRSLVCLPLLAG